MTTIIVGYEEIDLPGKEKKIPNDGLFLTNGRITCM